MSMARAIREQGYPCSVLTIDDRWESQFGDLRFSAAFPQPAEMVRELHDLGFKVLLWVTPFVNQEAENFAVLAAKEFLVRRADGNGPALLRWWGGTAGLVDLTHPPARVWFRDQLLGLQRELGVDGFKIDGGDAKYQPPLADSAWAGYRGPSGYADALLALFEEVAPGLCETRTAWRSQSRNILWREGGKDSHWGIDNGLKAMVNLGLHSALLGYDVLIPDMVPGRVQTLVAAMPLPSDELVVRWTEASAFFPILQFSYFPWNYGPATAAAVLAYARVHKALEPYLAAQAAGRCAPLLRPLWYDAPDRDQLYTTEDEFQLGSDLVVAPVTDECRVARDITLPPGRWADAWTGRSVRGTWLRQYPAPCPGIPVFVRQENRALLTALRGALQAVSRASVRSGVTTATYSAPLDRDLSVTG
jgi:alpha-glucosidase (family GH31 glycosyl hydrolase)